MLFRMLKLYGSPFNIDYVNAEGNISNYYRIFVKTDDKNVYNRNKGA